MATKRKNKCRKCEALGRQVRELSQRVAQLEADLAKARKNSTNSSKPPSSDIVNASKAEKQSKSGDKATRRTRGGQPGHPRHQRQPFSPDEVDVTWIHFYEGCPCCGGRLEVVEESETVLQQVEIKALPVEVTEHRRLYQECEECRRIHRIPWPEDLKRAGLVGPRLTALIGYMKSACHMSFSAMRKFLRDVVGVNISRGQLQKLVGKVSDSLLDPYEQLVAMLPDEDILNVDETGHKENGRRFWTWCFRAALYTVYKISPCRSSDVLLNMLGDEFNGVLGCDYFSAYRKYMKDWDVTVQFCLAHFIRDIKFLTEHPDRRNRTYGNRLLQHFRKLFQVIHRRETYSSEASFKRALTQIRNQIVADAIWKCPPTREAENLGYRLETHCDSFFTFITTPGVEPTNNLAEQAIRFVAIHRRITQGTRSKNGRDWCERIWTAVATCEQQNKSLFEYLCEVVSSFFNGEPAPPLVLDTS